MNIPIEEEKEFIAVEEGKHTGSITRIEQVDRKGYNYLDVFVTVEGVTVEDNILKELKASFPLPVYPNSMTGKFFDRFGLTTTPGENADPDNLVGELVQYLVADEEGKDGKTYATIQRHTLKPVSGR